MVGVVGIIKINSLFFQKPPGEETVSDNPVLQVFYFSCFREYDN